MTNARLLSLETAVSHHATLQAILIIEDAHFGIHTNKVGHFSLETTVESVN